MKDRFQRRSSHVPTLRSNVVERKERGLFEEVGHALFYLASPYRQSSSADEIAIRTPELTRDPQKLKVVAELLNYCHHSSYPLDADRVRQGTMGFCVRDNTLVLNNARALPLKEFVETVSMNASLIYAQALTGWQETPNTINGEPCRQYSFEPMDEGVAEVTGPAVAYFMRQIADYHGIADIPPIVTYERNVFIDEAALQRFYELEKNTEKMMSPHEGRDL